MSVLLSVDPGLRGCGVALFVDGVLVSAAYVEGDAKAKRADAWTAMAGAVGLFLEGCPVDVLAIELPQVYVQARQKGDPNDLIELAAVVGGICSLFPTAAKSVYLPAEWKGQVPKEIVHSRALARLSAEEQGVITCRRKSLLHNVYDAVALGLKHLKRM